jgi:hypothetical protein
MADDHEQHPTVEQTLQQIFDLLPLSNREIGRIKGALEDIKIFRDFAPVDTAKMSCDKAATLARGDSSDRGGNG